MHLSAPIHVLKRKAKTLKKSKAILLTEAYDIVAREEGYSSWSLLRSKKENILPRDREDILGYLNPGDMMLIGSRPGLGKTKETLRILLQAAKEKRQCYFFSMEYTYSNVVRRLNELGENLNLLESYLSIDLSDDISSGYIKRRTATGISEGSVVAVDYLQLLDQQRSKPDLQKQVEELRKFAKENGCIIIFISQVDRKFEEFGTEKPDLKDIRLPNPMDLSLFNKVVFLHNARLVFRKPKIFELPF